MTSNVRNVSTQQDFDKAVSTSDTAAVYFWAHWCQPCKQLDEVFAELAKDSQQAAFLRVEAEEVPDVTDRYGVTVVPYFLIVKDGRVIDKVEGADAAAVTRMVQRHCAQSRDASSKAGSIAPPQAYSNGSALHSSAAPSGQSLEEKVKQLISREPIMLFMKGTPEAPRCGFSRKVVDALQGTGEKFGTFDILTDEAVRQGIKEVSNWPTFPQVYVSGELLGGCDIIMELQQAGELKENIDEMCART
ncbi:g12080 [Coccomyxa viridis]|uniref:G12080 protein n=1 Tax=Coccomyxa viridis TaxID=1274662 RepID=A0ABP1G9G8_9CHLO